MSYEPKFWQKDEKLFVVLVFGRLFTNIDYVYMYIAVVFEFCFIFRFSVLVGFVWFLLLLYLQLLSHILIFDETWYRLPSTPTKLLSAHHTNGVPGSGDDGDGGDDDDGGEGGDNGDNRMMLWYRDEVALL